MEIKAADVAKLRKMTGAGMMDCKKALVEADGDFGRAQEIIREKGKLVAAKRADRETTEGAVIVKATNATAKVYTIDGKLLAAQSVNGTATIPTNGWSGVVIVRVENGNDVVVKKIVL